MTTRQAETLPYTDTEIRETDWNGERYRHTDRHTRTHGMVIHATDSTQTHHGPYMLQTEHTQTQTGDRQTVKPIFSHLDRSGSDLADRWPKTEQRSAS